MHDATFNLEIRKFLKRRGWARSRKHHDASVEPFHEELGAAHGHTDRILHHHLR